MFSLIMMGEWSVCEIVGAWLDVSYKHESTSMISYLYSLDTSHDELTIVPVVWDFSDIFAEVSGLPHTGR